MWLCQVFDGILLRCFLKKSLVKGIWNANEKARKMKKAFCFDICSCHYLRQNLSTSDLSFSQVTSVEKREPRKHFSASAYGLGFKNFSLGSLLSTSVTWKNLKSDVDKFFLRRGENNYWNKILFFPCATDEATIKTYVQTGYFSFPTYLRQPSIIITCPLKGPICLPGKN